MPTLTTYLTADKNYPATVLISNNYDPNANTSYRIMVNNTNPRTITILQSFTGALAFPGSAAFSFTGSYPSTRKLRIAVTTTSPYAPSDITVQVTFGLPDN